MKEGGGVISLPSFTAFVRKLAVRICCCKRFLSEAGEVAYRTTRAVEPFALFAQRLPPVPCRAFAVLMLFPARQLWLLW